jgi:hypothetical protein
MPLQFYQETADYVLEQTEKSSELLNAGDFTAAAAIPLQSNATSQVVAPFLNAFASCYTRRHLDIALAPNRITLLAVRLKTPIVKPTFGRCHILSHI